VLEWREGGGWGQGRWMPEGMAREEDGSLGGEPFLDCPEVCLSLSLTYTGSVHGTAGSDLSLSLSLSLFLIQAPCMELQDLTSLSLSLSLSEPP